jgi:hypothetical protein
MATHGNALVLVGFHIDFALVLCGSTNTEEEKIN